MEAVKQGSAAVGLKSKTHAILVALKVNCSFDEIIKTSDYDEPFLSGLYHFMD